MYEMKIDLAHVDRILSGEKTTTIRRLGVDADEIIPALYATLRESVLVLTPPTTNEIPVTLTSVTLTRIENLPDSVIQSEGVSNKYELFDLLRKYYPDLAYDEPVVLLQFTLATKG